MALNQVRTWLIAYDIADPKRLVRLHRYVKTVAIPVQYSVFVTEASDHGIRRIRDAIACQIDSKEDDVRIYPLPKNPEIHGYGQHYLPPGLSLLQGGEYHHSGVLAAHPTSAPDE